MKNNITDKHYWEEYWANYQYGNMPIKVVFEKFMPLLNRGKSFIEIGGFPGMLAAFFYNRGIKDVTVLDFHMNTDIVRKFEFINQLPQNTIQCIQADFFNFSSEKTYDIVFSLGFIEHFQDTKDVIQRHVNLLSPDGQLLILIPNFLGLNGKVQKWFDKENLDAHNLQSMEIPYLQNILQQTDLKDIQIDYLGKPMLWLEPKPENKNFRKLVKMFSYAAKLIPIKSKFLSPYIAIYARK